MNCKDFKKIIDDYSGIDISRKSRKRNYVFYRWVYFFLCKKYIYTANDTEVAIEVNQDRNTFRNGIDKLNNLLNWNKDIISIQKLSEIESIILEKYKKAENIKIEYQDFDKVDLMRDNLRLKNKVKNLQIKYV